jgi:hypothetical protein
MSVGSVACETERDAIAGKLTRSQIVEALAREWKPTIKLPVR